MLVAVSYNTASAIALSFGRVQNFDLHNTFFDVFLNEF
jgi:hypothetical protein